MNRLITFAGLLAACSGSNASHCPGAPSDNCNLIDAPIQGCTGDPQCSGATPVCDTTSKACVQCTMSEATACMGTTPLCGADEMCHGCTQHSDCASDVCFPDGSCSDGTNVAYVDQAGTDNAMCTKAMRCTKIASALATGRPYVKVTGTITEPVSLTNKNVTFLADPGAKLTESTSGIVLEVKGTSQVVVRDLTISDGLATGIGISMPTGNMATLTLAHVKLLNNAGGGLSASGGTVTITQSTVSGNAAGGLSISNAQFDLENNFIVSNGSVTSSFGGVAFNQITSGTRKVLFNTIANNGASSGSVSGVVCSLTNPAITFSDNIVYGNQVSSGGTQVGGANCAYTYSDIGPDTATGQGNINMAPLFVSVAQGNYHLQSGSPCEDVADPAAMTAVDFDGDARPQGTGRDIGADEYKP